MSIFASFLSTLLIAGVVACGSESDDLPPARAIFELPRDDGHAFFDLPWPTDLRGTESGHIDVRDFPNPRNNRFLSDYLEKISTRLDGWGTNGAAYLRFSAPVDPTSVPESSARTLHPEASVFLMDVDESSPAMGSRHPGVVEVRNEATLYWPAHTVAIRPVYGVPLSGGRRYAAVVTRGVRPQGGDVFDRSPDLEALLHGGGDAAVEGARARYEAALEVLEASGVARDDVLSLAVFTTQDPTSELMAVRDHIVSSYAEPATRNERWRWVEQEEGYVRVEGAYGPVPVLQSGESPFTEADSGEILMADGAPVVHGEFDAQFTLTVPRSMMPTGGYPIVLYAHGTFGDHSTFVENGVAGQLADHGFAVMGINQIFHGDRNPTGLTPELLVFNFTNPLAARDNNRQAAIDVVQQARMAARLEVPTRVLNRGAEPVRFDPDRMYVFGHSQGGLNLPLFLAIDDQTQGGVLSGAGATLAISVLEKTEPLSIAGAVQLVLSLSGTSPEMALEEEHFVFAHPVLTLLQTWVEAGDTSNYARYWFDRPRPGFTPKSVLMTEGLLDEFTPPAAAEALAAAARAPQIEPLARRIEAHELLGLSPSSTPASSNVADGRATGGVLQYAEDGHFAVFRNDVARRQVAAFLASLDQGVATIEAP